MSQITDSAPGGTFPRLGWVDDLLNPALRSAVAALPTAESRVAGYHRGWCEADGTPMATVSRKGKSVRPALVLLSAAAVGGSAELAVPGAVAVELVHDFSLLHDDVIDGDALRRHRPAAWSVFGTPAAVLTGDALLVSALRALADVPRRQAAEAVKELVTALLELVEGQSRDVAFEKAPEVSVAQYLAMAEGKTGSLMGCSCALGGVLAGADSERVRGLREFGRRLGVAFQCADDVLGIWGRTARSGKPVGADLAARKKSLPVVAALSGEGAAAERLGALYASTRPLDEQDVALARELVEEAGGRQAAEQEARRQVSAALRALSWAQPTPDAYRQLHDIAWAMTLRES
ncbi:polyprenyl synthetase family protein [Streptomyces coeruleorubidus]|uniref:polyprenyl synthetase family protein n=1 Tax=Streptomyces coeruleorubidus TaxID=116188 RepID=UPI00237F1FFC|nr:polyprenyl synthetase family protein [Streptomyces coeruleorubidus]WDV53809.1 polyprenyl synthetase family protein [Streptomyces coeruleorubidus]